MYDVMVIGAGPVGSYVAYRLASEGHRVVVFERQSGIGDAVCCTGIVGAECLAKFPVPESCVATHANSCKVFSPGGKRLRLWKDSVQAHIVDRRALDRGLAGMAQEHGVDYRLSARVESIGLIDHRVSAQVNNGCGPGGVEAKLAILCNGFGSSLPRRMGLGQVGDFVLGAQAEVEIKEADEVEVYLGHDVAPGFFAWLVPTFPGRGLAGLLSRRNPGLFMKEFLARLASQGRIASTDAEIAYGGIPLRPLPRTYGDRVVAIGDAAGHVKPTTGGGIYYGLLSADIAANTIHEALCAGDLTAERLKRYERGWKKVLGRDLQIGYWSRRLYESLSNKRIDRLFDVIEADGVHEALLQSPGFSFDWHSDSIVRALRHKAVRRTIWSATKSVLS